MSAPSPAGPGRAGDRRHRAPARPWSSSTTRTARTRATSSSPPRKATPELLAFMIRHTSGVVCVPMEGAELDRLKLPPMTAVQRGPQAHRVLGLGRRPRRRQHRHLGRRPGAHHPGPGRLGDRALRARPGPATSSRCAPWTAACCARTGHTEASVDLARLAGLTPAGVLAEVVNDDGTMTRLPELREFADEHGLALVSIADLVTYRRRTETLVDAGRRGPAADPRTASSAAVGYRSTVDATEHLALVRGDIGDGTDVLVRVHSECLTGDVLGSLRCDCGPQLDAALRTVADEGRGVVVYLRGHEGRGIGLLHKLRGLPAAGRRPGHRRRQPRPRAARRRARLQRRRADPADLGVSLGAAADQQPGRSRSASRRTAFAVIEQVPLEVHP